MRIILTIVVLSLLSCLNNEIEGCERIVVRNAAGLDIIEFEEVSYG